MPHLSSGAGDPLGGASCPLPQRVRRAAGAWRLPQSVLVQAPDVFAASPALGWLRRALERRGHTLEAAASARGASFELAIEPHAGHDERYRVEVAQGKLTLVAAGLRGLQHGLATLAQRIELAPGDRGSVELPLASIEDWPDYPVRGVMLDVSRDRVPRLDALRRLVDVLARLKLNQLQLYMEHTFAYAGHERVWRDASPFTALEIRELDAYCAERNVELVPNQNSFGHMHRWLQHEPYRALAECPDGFDHPWNWTGEPYGLCATDPASLEFLAGLYDELLPNFRSRLFNVGLDETLDLGHGRSRAACEARGTERVYLDFLRQVQARVRERGRVMQFWGDIIVNRPELVAELPRDVIALEWGYEADHPFAEHLALFRQAGLEFYVCPGTSSWNSLGGRTDNAITNIARAAVQGNAHGASGLLLTDWGDHGHLQPPPVSYLGFALGAALSWNVSAAATPALLDVCGWLDNFLFQDDAAVLGRVAYELGNTYREAGSLRPNASVLFWTLLRPERLTTPPGVTRATLERALEHVEHASAPLGSARPRAEDGALVVSELGWVRDMLRFTCQLGMAQLTLPSPAALGALPAATRAELARALGPLIEQHRALWTERSRPGGLADSARRLEHTLDLLRSPA